MLKNKFIFLFFLTLKLQASEFASLYFQGNCITCHHKTLSISAPSMLLVQQRYKRAFIEKKDFISYLSKWVQKPNKETSIMLDMIEKYGLMPELVFSQELLEDIASYIYDTNFSTLK